MEPALSAAAELFAAARRLPSDPGAPLARRLAARPGGCEGFAQHSGLEDDVFLLLVGTTPRAIGAPLAAVQLARARLRHPGGAAQRANASLDALAAAGLVAGDAAAWPPAAFAVAPGSARPRFFAALAEAAAEGGGRGVSVWSGGAWGLLAWRAGGALFREAGRAWGYAAATGALLEQAEAPGAPAFRPAAAQPCPFAVMVRGVTAARFARRATAALCAARRGGVVCEEAAACRPLRAAGGLAREVTA